MIRWALGVLIYFMLQSDMPFGSWRESELEPVTKIAKGHLVIPSTFSAEVVDLITKVTSNLDNCNSTLRLFLAYSDFIQQNYLISSMSS
jgi:hypothetical protein